MLSDLPGITLTPLVTVYNCMLHRSINYSAKYRFRENSQLEFGG